jgi:hypothetical protein
MYPNFAILGFLLLSNTVHVNAGLMNELGEIAFLVYLAVVITAVLIVFLVIKCIICLCSCFRPSPNINNTNIIVDRRKRLFCSLIDLSSHPIFITNIFFSRKANNLNKQIFAENQNSSIKEIYRRIIVSNSNKSIVIKLNEFSYIALSFSNCI